MVKSMVVKIGRAVLVWTEWIMHVLLYEPTWFAEFGFGVAAIGWGYTCLISSDYHASRWQLALPLCAIALGVCRCMVVMRLWYAARVILTALSMLLWSWIFWSLAGKFGIVSQEGILIGVFVIEALTAAKFSIPCAREIIDEADWFRPE